VITCEFDYIIARIFLSVSKLCS